MPPEAEYVMPWFRSMDAARGNNGFGFSPLSWSDIHAWFSLHRIAPNPLELRIVRALDRAWLHAFNKKGE